MKFRSSIFSFDTLQESPLRLLRCPSAIGILALIGLIELSLRAAIPPNQIPRGAFHNGELRQQHRQLEDLHHVDLMFAGSSIAAVNYPPAAFDQRMKELGHEDFISFNAGIRGCNWVCIGAGLESVFLREAVPQTLVLIVSPHDFDESNQVVYARSREFLSSFETPTYKRQIQNVLSSALWLYGFDAQIRHLLTTGNWGFDSASVTIRGHIDMGSTTRPRRDWRFAIDPEGPIALAFYRTVKSATDRGMRVFLVLETGDSRTRASFGRMPRQKLVAIMEKAATHPSVRRIAQREATFDDADYIDNLHLNSSAARVNARLLADHLVENGHF